jgi:hypothetical protein
MAMDLRAIRIELEKLRDQPELKNGFPDKDSALNWANQVAPLLQFNQEYYINFIAPLHELHANISAYSIEPRWRLMISQIDRAIADLKYRESSIASKTQSSKLSMQDQPKKEEVMNHQIRLFISHSSADNEFVKPLAKILQLALRLSASEIRCTSLDGYRLPGGANTSEQLRSELETSDAFIGIISHSSLRSHFVLLEHGARWGLKKSLIPLLAPNTPLSLLKSGPLSEVNELQADSTSQLHQLISDLGTILGVEPEKPAAYECELNALATAHLSGNLVILEALYGARDHRLDVTDALNTSIRENKLHIYVGNQLGGDPCPGTRKDIIVKYKYQNTENTKVCIEREDLDLP